MRKRLFSFFIFLFTLLLFIGAAQPASADAAEDGGIALRLTDERQVYNADSKIWIWTDPERTLTIEDVSQPGKRQEGFIRNTSGSPNYGYKHDAYWVKLLVRNDAEMTQWYLDIDNAPLDSVRLYMADATGRYELKMESGDFVRHRDRDATGRTILFPLELAPGMEQTIYLRIETMGGAYFPIRILHPHALMERTQHTSLLFGGYYGIVIVLALLNSVLAITLRSKAYFYYVCITISTLLLYFTFNGFAFQYLWPDAVWWNNRAIVFFMAAGHISALLFVRAFLNISEVSRKLDRVLIAFLVLELASIGILMFNYPLGLFINSASIVAVDSAIILAGVLSLRAGNKSARYFLIGWSVFLTGAIITTLSDEGVLHASWFTVYASQIGNAFEAMILSWALAYRIKSTQREKDSAIIQMEAATHLASIDPNTGVYNRRYIAESFRSSVLSGEKVMSVLLLDIDHFKSINDRYGHDVGDKALQDIAALMKACFRPSDVVARFGGEEFIVLLRETNVDQAHKAAQYLQDRIRKHRFAIGDLQFQCTASMGIGEWKCTKPDDFHAVVKRADQALYRAKSNGRNKICIDAKQPEAANE